MEKILLLGGSPQQIPAIDYAKKQDYYTILCDFLSDNPGQYHADKFYCVSTTDKEAVLEVAEKEKVDGVIAYASDPAAPTASYVSETLGLPGNKYSIVKIMSEKDLFRNFLLKNGFNTPQFKFYSNLNSLLSDFDTFDRPMILKPVDSSGSKGVARIQNFSTIPALFTEAMNYSRCKRIIVEEYIDGPQLHGDAFVSNGKVVFSYLGDHYFNGMFNSSTMYPSQFPKSVIREMEKELQRFIGLVGFQIGSINVEFRISNREKKFYIIEVGPRNGGHYTPNIIQYASGFNLIKASVDTALGKEFEPQEALKKGYYVNLVLYSMQSGIFQGVEFSENLKQHILETFINKKKGDEILSRSGSNTAVGVLLLNFRTMEEMHYYVDNSNKFYDILLN